MIFGRQFPPAQAWALWGCTDACCTIIAASSKVASIWYEKSCNLADVSTALLLCGHRYCDHAGSCSMVEAAQVGVRPSLPEDQLQSCMPAAEADAWADLVG